MFRLLDRMMVPLVIVLILAIGVYGCSSGAFFPADPPPGAAIQP